MPILTRRVRAVFSHHVPADRAGAPLLEYLRARFPYHSTQEWTERIGDGRVLVDGKPSSPEIRITAATRVEYALEDYAEPVVPTGFYDISRKEDLALLHKPAGMPVHSTGKVFVHTLANLHAQQHGREWSPLHRLDVETSGVVAFARGREALRRFAPTGGARWRKLYLAAVQGETDAQGCLDIPLAENPEDPIRIKMRPHPEGKPAITHYRRLLHASGRALLLLRPLTGRKHQIRAHCAAARFPVIGDKIYSCDGRYYLKRMTEELNRSDFKKLGAPHQLLHAFHLEIGDEMGAGIKGADFALPAAFHTMFPDLLDFLPSLSESRPFRELLAVA